MKIHTFVYRYLITSLVIIFIYLGLVILARQLVHFTGFVSPFWPAVGFSWAMLLIKGVRYWPSIWLGAFIGDFWLVEQTLQHQWVAAVTALGTLLQVLVGVGCKNCFFKESLPVFPKEKTIWCLLLFCGPVTCLIAPTVGITSRYFAHIGTADHLWADWLVWWVGDTLGFLLIGPWLVISLLSKVHGREEKIVGGLVLLGSVMLLSLGLLALQAIEKNEEEGRHVAIFKDIFYETLQPILTKLYFLRSVEHLLMASESLTREQFLLYTEALISMEGLDRIEWLPNINHHQRDDFESQFSEVYQTTANGEEVRAGQRLSYFPVQFTRSKHADVSLAGFDRASRAICQQAMRQSLHTNRQIATQVIPRSYGGKPVIHVFMPIYTDRISRDGALAARQLALRGYLMAEIDVETIAGLFVSRAKLDHVVFQLKDVTEVERETLLAKSELPLNGHPEWIEQIDFAGRLWQIELSSADGHWFLGKERADHIYLWFELLLGLLVTGLVLQFTNHSAHIKLTVKQRTSELEKANTLIEDAMSVANMAYWAFDVGTGHYHFNDRFYHLLGTSANREGGYYMPAEAYLSKFCHPEDVARVLTEITNSQQPSSGIDCGEIQHRIVHAGGEIRHLLVRYRLYWTAAGKLEWIQGASLEISPLVKANELLLQSEQKLVALNRELDSRVKQRTKQLAYQEQRFRDLFQYAPDATLMTDQQGLITEVNQRMETLFGWSQKELLGNTIEMLVPRNSSNKHVALRTTYITAPSIRSMGAENSADLLGLHKSGRSFPVDISLSPLQFDNQHFIVASVRDVSEREASQQAVRETLAVLNAMNDAAFIFKPEKLQFTFINEGAVKQLGYSRQKLLTMNMLDIKPQFTMASLSKLLDEVKRVPGRPHQFKTVHRKSDGIDLPVEITLQYIEPQKGDPRFVELVRDISQRIRLEKQAQEMQTMFSQAQALAQLAWASWDVTLGEMRWSEQLFKILGLKHDEHVPSLELYLACTHPEDRAALRAKIDQCLHDGLPQELEHRVVHLDGTIHFCKSFAQTMLDPTGKPLKMTGAFLDVTEHKLNEEKLQVSANQLRRMSQRLVDVQEEERRSLATELHDQVGQNLTALSISLAILSRELAPQESGITSRLYNCAELVESTISSIELVINNLRPPMLTGSGLDNIVRWYVDLFRKHTNLPVKVTVDGQQSPLSSVLETGVLRIVQEALNNVAKHANASQVNVHIWWQERGFSIVISDDGVGFDMNSAIEKNRLGLLIMKERATAIGASLTIHTSFGNGVRVVVDSSKKL